MSECRSEGPRESRSLDYHSLASRRPAGKAALAVSPPLDKQPQPRGRRSMIIWAAIIILIGIAPVIVCHFA